jgi:hypothetical protein
VGNLSADVLSVSRIDVMPKPHVIEQWLQDAGYRYHCYISWPHTENELLTECAIRVKEAIEQYLALSISEPSVFIDDEIGISPGAKWKETLRWALCRSVAMVAICAPIYFHPSHEWCGREWAAMTMLGQSRLPDEDLQAIIPTLVKVREPLPNAVQESQAIDLSRVIICGRRYFSTQEFRTKAMAISENILEIAGALKRDEIQVDCEKFQIPAESAFLDYTSKQQPFPFRS